MDPRRSEFPPNCSPSRGSPGESLHRDTDRNSGARIPAVIQVVAAIGVNDINIVGVVPIVPPVFGPWVNGTEPIALVLEPRKSAHNQEGKARDAESVISAKVSAETIVRNVITAVATALLPGAVVGLPVSRAMLLPGALLDMLLLLCALRLLSLLSLLLLSMLRLATPGLPLRWLSVLRLLLSLPLGWLNMLRLLLSLPLGWLSMWLFRPGVVLLFAMLLLLSVGRSSNSKQQRQNGCAADSNSHVC
jgi:hypothetical protein